MQFIRGMLEVLASSVQLIRTHCASDLKRFETLASRLERIDDNIERLYARNNLIKDLSEYDSSLRCSSEQMRQNADRFDEHADRLRTLKLHLVEQDEDDGIEEKVQ